jgi:hypothetical protein
MLKVYPTLFPKKYYKWLYAKPKKKLKFSSSDTTLIQCNATYYKIENRDTIEIWNKKLINQINPMFVIVADDGNSFVTFDNWSSLGHGTDVMVTYDGRGELIKKYQLADFSVFPINDYTETVTSIWWRYGAKYVDNNTIEIGFQDKNKNIKTRLYNLTTREFN